MPFFLLWIAYNYCHSLHYFILRSKFRRNNMIHVHPRLIEYKNFMWKKIYVKIDLICLDSCRKNDLYIYILINFSSLHSFCTKTFQCVLAFLILDLSLDLCSIWIKKQIVRDRFRFSKTSVDLGEHKSHSVKFQQFDLSVIVEPWYPTQNFFRQENFISTLFCDVWSKMPITENGIQLFSLICLK